MIHKFGNFINDLFEKYRLVRRTLVIFSATLVGWTTVILYTNLELVTAAVVSLHGITVGILSTAIARYFYERHNSPQGQKEKEDE